jgi:hypothetical protein
LADGFPNRYFEFQDFERKFEECISKSAVRTKFEQHLQQGKLIVTEIRTVMDGTYDRAQQLRTEKSVAKKEIHDKLNFTEQQLLLLTQEMKDKIRQMVEDVEQRVSCFTITPLIGFYIIRMWGQLIKQRSSTVTLWSINKQKTVFSLVVANLLNAMPPPFCHL